MPARSSHRRVNSKPLSMAIPQITPLSDGPAPCLPTVQPLPGSRDDVPVVDEFMLENDPRYLGRGIPRAHAVGF